MQIAYNIALSVGRQKTAPLKSNVMHTLNICYVSNILTVGSEPVISFFNEGKSSLLGLPSLQFCK
jgi:hypothetical protein